MQPIVVNGQNIDGVSLILQPGVTISGNITVESAGAQAPTDYSGFRVDAPDVAPLPFGAGPGGGRGGAGGERAQKNGAFAVGDLVPGKHYIRVTGGAPAAAQGRGQGSAQVQWTLKSVIVAGQEVSDQPVDLKPGQNLDNVTVVLTDRTTEISGTVRDGRSEPLSGFTVIVFSSEPQFWGAQSRHIRATRTDTAGTFRVSGMPPGDYLAVAVDAVEQGEWFDPAYLEQIRPGARQITINEGEKKTQDLRGPS